MSSADENPVLAGAQISRYFREGYLVVEDITTREDIALIQSLLDPLFERIHELPDNLAFDLGSVKNHDGKQVTPQVNQASQFEPRLTETLFYRNALAVARQLLGPEAAHSFNHAIYKPPRNQRETPWHQDMSYGVARAKVRPTNLERFGCNIWLPLQDTGIDGGCMQFIPRSHWGNYREHYPVGHDEKVHTLMTDDVEPSRAVPCPLQAGSATIHHPKTLHYTGPNNSEVPRRAWILAFGHP